MEACVNLKWLAVVQNKLESLKGIEGLTKLTVSSNNFKFHNLHNSFLNFIYLPFWFVVPFNVNVVKLEAFECGNSYRISRIVPRGCFKTPSNHPVDSILIKLSKNVFLREQHFASISYFHCPLFEIEMVVD